MFLGNSNSLRTREGSPRHHRWLLRRLGLDGDLRSGDHRDHRHAESVEVVYDPSKITYGQLLRIFFSVAHDPTQLNRQGPDVGTSYRSAIFYINDDQKRIATAYITQLDAAKAFPKKIVTEVTPLKGFYRAEDYHQDYALYHEDNPYIQICDRPKIGALKEQFPDLFVDYKGKK